ncbi:uncharacterized protein BDZ83DRAFT_733308 [Colletotrichum acutatum]|uniref:Uncharacterized protein n=1 Tax=Glomerella acutata TaxID=27357 RepID=A0AAD8XBX3_GLOAC|nr:uncharacterized protein BDZ83DRAFT_733308 [Colletotrichum acutatum]KAK1719528.1 hypothetical protein BDZ83DRAFT_733308 [Colletotrichum acutatum]
MLVSQFRGSQSAVAQLASRADDLGAPHLPLNGMLSSSPTNRAYRLIGYRQLPDKMEEVASAVHNQESGDPEETRVNSTAILTVLGIGMLAVSVITGKRAAGPSDPPQPVLSHLRFPCVYRGYYDPTEEDVDVGWAWYWATGVPLLYANSVAATGSPRNRQPPGATVHVSRVNEAWYGDGDMS